MKVLDPELGAVGAGVVEQLYYRLGTRVMSASVTANPEFTVTDRRLVFDKPYGAHPYHQNFDVMADGKTFVMLQPGVTDSRQLIVALNWMSEVRKQLAPSK